MNSYVYRSFLAMGGAAAPAKGSGKKEEKEEEKLKDKFDAGDKEKIESALQETLDWLERNQMAETDEFEAKQKELEGVVNPIMMKVYQAAGGGGDMPDMGGMGGAGAPPPAGGPTAEEVD